MKTVLLTKELSKDCSLWKGMVIIMKHRGKIIVGVVATILALLIMPYIISRGEYDVSTDSNQTNNTYLKFYDFDPNAETGSIENPFIILEIVPYRGMGQIGYLVGGQEPIDPKVSTYRNNIYGVFQGFAQGAFKVSKVKKDILSEQDRMNGGFEWRSYQLANQEGYFIKVNDSNGLYEMKTSGNNLFFEKVKDGKGSYNWVNAINQNNTFTDYTSDMVWLKNYTLDVSCYENIGDWLFENTEIFKRQVLHINDDYIVSYHIRVITITPEELNKNVAKFTKYYDLSNQGRNTKIMEGANNEGEIDLIANADFISISPSAQAGNNSVIDYWERYGTDKSGITNAAGRYTTGFGSNDLDWQTVMELFLKVGVIEDSAALAYDITCFDVPPSPYQDNVPSLIGSEGKRGFLNNMYKLLLLLRQRNPVELYNLYFNTNNGELIPSVTMNRNYKVTTGSFNMQNNEASKVYWNSYTFLPKFPDGTYPGYISQPSPDYQKYLAEQNIILGWYDKHDAVIRNTYSYNGTSTIAQNFINLDWGLIEVKPTNTAIGYSADFFEYLKDNSSTGTKPNNASPSQAVEYILKKKPTRVSQKSSIKVLELQPSNDFSLTIEQLRTWLPTYSGYIEIVRQTSAEFIGKVEDLNYMYDLIYIGTNTGKMNVDSTGKTIYNDPQMDGLIYSHVGDRILGFDNFLGVLKENNNVIKAMSYINFSNDETGKSKIFKGYSNSEFQYIKNVADFYRFSGNDITNRKKEELQDYMNGGYPVLLEEKLYECNNVILDDSSNLYQFLYLNKNSNEFINKNNLLKQSTWQAAQRQLLQHINKEKLKLQLTIVPKEFEVDNKDSLIVDRTLTYEFKVQSTEAIDSLNQYKWRIYVDTNADGRFVEDEQILSGVVGIDEVVYKRKKLSEKYVGVIAWKLEVVHIENSNLRTEQCGYAAFKTLADTEMELEKTKIHILQITSDSSTLNLQELVNPSGNKTSLFYEYTNNLDDFNVNIKTITVSQLLAFYQGTGNAYDKNNPLVTDKLFFVEDGVKKSYDMLLFGFGDCYSDINNDRGALNNVQAFIDSGRSVMFTHDTTSFVNIKVSGDKYDNTGTGKTLSNWGYGFNQYLRNRVGLDRFGVMKEAGDTTVYDTASMPSKVDKSIYKSGALTKNQTIYPEIQGYTYGNLVAFGNPHNNPWNSIYEANKNYPPFATGNSISKGTGIDHYFTNYVTKVNEGQITNYPYKIPNGFKISTTHTQYYQMNMEDPEIVVWFCLSDEYSNQFRADRTIFEINSHSKETGPYSSSPNDVRNNYYIYSKGNVMYTGVGHSSMDKLVKKGELDYTNANEVKLFINTMIASYNAGVTSPSVAITNQEAIQKNPSDYILYEESEGYAKETGATRKIYFVADDKNLTTEEVIVRVYFYDETGAMVLKNPVIKRGLNDSSVDLYYESGREPGYLLMNGEEYYFELPLSTFAFKGMDKVTIIVTNQYNLNSAANALIQNRVLFDLH